MNKLICLIVTCSIFSFTITGNKLFTNKGHVSFYSSTPIEDIEANNDKVSSVLNPETGEMAFSMKIKDFIFDKKLMQDHFNENYLESDKYPNSTFKGKITNLDEIKFLKDGSYTTNVEGDLTIHNVTKSVKTIGTIEVKKDKVNAKSKFKIKLVDYNIEVPKIVFQKIAEEIEISVDLNYDSLNK